VRQQRGLRAPPARLDRVCVSQLTRAACLYVIANLSFLLLLLAAGEAGSAGPTGPTGPPGVAGYANFFALMPGDNAATVAPGAAVSFPQDGATFGGVATRLSGTQFTLDLIGTYLIFFQVSITEAGQLMIRQDGTEVAYTVVGRATGTSQIVGVAIPITTVAASVIEVINPSGNAAALTITPIAGGTHSVSANLTVLFLG